jgi:hypothetical protein
MTAVTRGPYAASEGTRPLKKSLGRRGQRVALREAFMAAPPDGWPVALLCEVLDVSRRGLSASLLRHATAAVDAAEVA